MVTPLSATLRDGMAAAHARDFERARPLLDRAAGETPDRALPWFWAAVAAPSASEAARCLRRVLAVDNSHAAAREALARLLVARANALAGTDRARACTMLGEASELAPNVEAVWIALATHSDTPAERLNALRRAASLAPHRADLRARLHEVVLHQAVLLAKQGNRTAARTLFREAGGLAPNDSRAWQALARLAETPADAIEALRQLVRAAPHHPARADLKKALAADARALDTAGRKVEALGRWREAIALDKKDPESWLGLASAAVDEAEIRRAVETAHGLDPANAQAAAWIARLRAKDGTAGTAAAAAAPSRRTVMVVDDSPTIRKILGLTLERAGYDVVAEPDGERAVERLAAIVPDLILLDITMPKLDGYEVCRRIKKDPRTTHVPVVMLSGKDGFFDKVKGRMVGATEYLTKPFQAPAVLAVIASHCQGGPEVSHG